jgi:hypothetical protein|tara:strand:+ start:728 stop:1234 length:507 start_codon:yes stop_codon:yes gene_type:complete
MNKREFVSVMDYLSGGYKGEELNKKQLSVYYESLGVFEPEMVLQAVKEWIEKSPFFPKVADLLKIIRNTEITYDNVIKELHGILALTPGESFSRDSIHSVSYQILKELGGKMSISQMSEKELRKQVRMKYGYVVGEKIQLLRHDETPQIERRSNRSEGLKTALERINT